MCKSGFEEAWDACLVAGGGDAIAACLEVLEVDGADGAGAFGCLEKFGGPEWCVEVEAVVFELGCESAVDEEVAVLLFDDVINW